VTSVPERVLATALHRFRCGVSGTAAIEFGLFAPLLLIMLVYAVELGSGVFEAMQVQNAAEAGALYAAKYGWNAAGISAAVITANHCVHLLDTQRPAGVPHQPCRRCRRNTTFARLP
jgi:Flp pilus assembly pilin Flp